MESKEEKKFYMEPHEVDVPQIDIEKFEMVQAGTGSASDVYKAWLKSERERIVAVKVLKKHIAYDACGLSSFQKEINMLSRLSHPNIISVLGVGHYDGLPCALLEWCSTDVNTLLRIAECDQRKIRKHILTKYPSEYRLRLVRDLAHAVRYLHSGSAIPGCFVLHRDIKPENLLLLDADNDHSLKLADFGLAVGLAVPTQELEQRKSKQNTSENEAGTQEPVQTESLFRHGDTLADYELTAETGTLRYMAPEVARRENYGLRADVYSFAVVAWEILVVGGKPFSGLHVGEHYNRVVVRGHRPNIPKEWHPDLQNLITAAWHHNPRRRPPFSAICNMLDEIIKGTEDVSSTSSKFIHSISSRDVLAVRSLSTQCLPTLC
uniref:Protein kinase domain-containing protein n=1 Tax=Aureoumbra lagunensis TaxID=44058 RepID=A0A7S3NIV9_9STRA